MPSGSKKRKAAKKKKEALAAHVGADGTTADYPSSATTLLVSPGNGNECGEEFKPLVPQEVGSPGDDKGVMDKGDGAFEGLETVVTEKYEENGDENGEKQTKQEDDTSCSSDSSSAEVPARKAEDLAAERVDFSEQVESGGSVLVPQAAEVPMEEELVTSVDVVEREEVPREEVVVTSADVVKLVPCVEKLASELEEAASVQGGIVPVETVEYLSTGEPIPAKVEEKDLSLSVAPRGQTTESSEQLQQPEGQGIGNEVRGALTPEVGRRTSWLSCCGLFDAFRSSNR